MLNIRYRSYQSHINNRSPLYIRVYFRDKVEKTIILVGSEEADAVEGKISNESPLGKAILGKGKGDSVVVSAPKGEIVYTIKAIA